MSMTGAKAATIDATLLPARRTGGLSRRSFLIGAGAGVAALSLAGCGGGMSLMQAQQVYGPLPNEKFPIPPVDLAKLDQKYWRRTVPYESKEAPGTIIIDPKNYYVYRIEDGKTATRYGANVGRDGFRWNGDVYVGRKGEWATWTPPKEMIARQPEAAKYAAGMPGGYDNPLGARTLYLYQDGKYTLYTIYATHYPSSIGKGVTSGCTGLLTQDMIDLYDRTAVGTKVIMLPS